VKDRISHPYKSTGKIIVLLVREVGMVQEMMHSVQFRRKTEEVAGGWRRLHNEKLHNMYSSLNIIRMIKSSFMGPLWLYNHGLLLAVGPLSS
jgi:hypothetical protein